MITLFLGAITLLGIFLRIVNTSPFKFYPDAYQNLIVAQNLLTYHSVFGKLGEMGMFFPYFFMWTRPGYPLLINLFNIVTQNPLFSAQLINLLAGILSIPIAYLFIKKVFASGAAGLVGALITAISFNSIVWGGFIYTESLGVLLILLLLWRLFTDLEKESKWANLNDFLTGLIFSFAVFTRYEYLVLAIPIAFLILQKNPSPLKKLINIFISSAFLASIVLSQFYPVAILSGLIFFQLHKLLIIFGFLLGAGVLGLILLKLKSQRMQMFKKADTLIICLIFILAALIVIQSFLGETTFAFYQLTAIRNFFINDFFLGILSLIGFTLLLKSNSNKTLIYFALISILVLFPVYYNINPQMQRYITHLLPFLLIPATLAGWKAPKYPVILISILILLSLQVIVSFQGIKNWHDGSWFRQSYEEKSARLLSGKLPREGNYLLISSMPEAYYFFTGRSTDSIGVDDKSPFIYIDPELDSQTVYIIDDMGMSDLFPNFKNLLDQKLTNLKVFEYRVNETYRYGIRSIPESRPVIIYKTTVGDLKQQIIR